VILAAACLAHRPDSYPTTISTNYDPSNARGPQMHGHLRSGAVNTQSQSRRCAISPDAQTRRVFFPVSAVVSHTAGRGEPAAPSNPWSSLRALTLLCRSLLVALFLGECRCRARLSPYLCRLCLCQGECRDKAADAQSVSGCQRIPGRRRQAASCTRRQAAATKFSSSPSTAWGRL
jgi:hypothetical protein